MYRFNLTELFENEFVELFNEICWEYMILNDQYEALYELSCILIGQSESTGQSRYWGSVES